MRKFLISAALLASTVAVAAPAAAQWAPPQGYGYGYQGNQGQVRSRQARLSQLHNRIHRLEGRLSQGEFLRLNREIDVLQDRLRRASYRGIGPREAYELDRRIARVERVIYRYARNGYGGHHGANGYNQYAQYDRDRDGRDDRYEDDRGRDHDDRDDNDDD